MNRIRTAFVLVAVVLPVTGCDRPEPDRTEEREAARIEEQSRSFVNRVWTVAESTGMSPGQLVVFLSDGTLVFASPHGEPALGRWRQDGDELTMVEEGIPYRVEILELADNELRIRSHHPSGSVDTRLVSADLLLEGTRWRLDDLAGAGTLEEVEATLEFLEDGRVAGSGSCNRFSGAVEISGDAVRFGPLGLTRMACPESVMAQEGRYVQALEDAERFTFDEARLFLHVRGLDSPLRFVRTGP